MISMGGDTSGNVMILVIARNEEFKIIHKYFCGYLGFSSDCYPHFHSLSSKRRRYLAGKVSMNIEKICRHIIHVEIIIARWQFKLHSGKIVNTIISLRNKYHVDRIILGSDFLYYMKNSLNKIGPHIIDDRAIEVQVQMFWQTHIDGIGKYLEITR